jgi:hypothetical protein
VPRSWYVPRGNRVASNPIAHRYQARGTLSGWLLQSEFMVDTAVIDQAPCDNRGLTSQMSEASFYLTMHVQPIPTERTSGEVPIAARR